MNMPGCPILECNSSRPRMFWRINESFTCRRGSIRRSAPASSRSRSSPLVRKVLTQAGNDLAMNAMTNIAGDIEAFAPAVDMELDAGIRQAVLILRRAGIETFESCEGGDGHAFEVPTV